MWARWLVLLAAISGCDQVWGLERTDEVPEPSGTWRSVTAGERHTCAIRTDDTLWCWGAADYGQVGVDVPVAAEPVQVGTGRWREVSGRGEHTCALAEDRSLWCWGDNGYGQLGIGDASQTPGPNLIAGGPWEHDEATRYHTCAIATDATLWCWGDNANGQLGDGTQTRHNTPQPLAGTTRDRFRSLSLGLEHSCAIRDDDSLWCWGQTYYGALADPNLSASTNQLVPNRVRGAWTTVAAGALHTCAISTERRVRCWGWNQSGELGDGTTSTSTLGVDVGGSSADWVELVAGADHSCGRRESGGLFCWGTNRHGEIPSADLGEIVSLPVPIAPRFDPWTGAMGLGLRHSCLIDGANRLWCVGGNSAGQLGRGTGPHFRPTKLDGEWLDVSAGDRMTCALDPARDAYCWGDSAYSGIGDGTLSSRQAPTKIAEAGPWDAIITGGQTACAKRGTARWCWGSNASKQIGIPGSADYLYLPKRVDDNRWPQGVRYHMCSVTAGDLYCWGPGNHGMLGLGDIGSRDLPTQVTSPVVVWKLVGAGNQHTCGASDAGLYCWGYNAYHQLGDGSIADRNSPILISNGAVDTLSVGSESACMIRAGSASCWGFGGNGNLGNGSFTDEPVPRALAGTWRAIATSDSHSCGISGDGSLWCWGSNADGRLGDGTRTSHTTPVQIDSGTDWERVILGRNHSCALKVDRSLWCWGANPTGEIGDGTSWSSELQLVD